MHEQHGKEEERLSLGISQLWKISSPYQNELFYAVVYWKSRERTRYKKRQALGVYLSLGYL